MKAKVNARQRREAEALRRKCAVGKETVSAGLLSAAPEKPAPVFDFEAYNEMVKINEQLN